MDYKKEDWEFTLNLDLTSVFEVTKIFAGYMKKNIEAGKQTYGRVINIASIYGLVGNTAIPTIAYHATVSLPTPSSWASQKPERLLIRL